MEVLESKNLPAGIGKSISLRQQLIEKLAFLAAEKKKISDAEKALNNLLQENDKIFLMLHKERGDFEVGGFTVKKTTGYSTVVVDESKLPKDCFTYKATVSLTKVKEHILEQNIPKEVAFMQKSESVSVK